MERCYFMGNNQKTIFEWKVGDFPLLMNYSMHKQDSYTITSPDFPTDGKSKWELQLKLNNNKESTLKEWVSILLNSRSSGDIHIFKIKYSLFIFDYNKEKKFKQKSYQVVRRMETFCIPKFLEVNQLLGKKDELLPDNELTICIKITEFSEHSHVDAPIIKIPLKTLNHKIVHDLKDLFDSRAGSDIVLVVGDKKIPAHRTLLMSRSPVFSAMFTHQLKENRENEVEIPDMDPDICEKLLEFIYTDNVTKLDGVSERLYEVADKYQIPTLKESCEESLCKNVTVENAVKYLVLLDRHSADERFFKYIVDFMAINSKKFLKPPNKKP